MRTRTSPSRTSHLGCNVLSRTTMPTRTSHLGCSGRSRRTNHPCRAQLGSAAPRRPAAHASPASPAPRRSAAGAHDGRHAQRRAHVPAAASARPLRLRRRALHALQVRAAPRPHLFRSRLSSLSPLAVAAARRALGCPRAARTSSAPMPTTSPSSRSSSRARSSPSLPSSSASKSRSTRRAASRSRALRTAPPPPHPCPCHLLLRHPHPPPHPHPRAGICFSSSPSCCCSTVRLSGTSNPRTSGVSVRLLLTPSGPASCSDHRDDGQDLRPLLRGRTDGGRCAVRRHRAGPLPTPPSAPRRQMLR